MTQSPRLTQSLPRRLREPLDIHRSGPKDHPLADGGGGAALPT